MIMNYATMIYQEGKKTFNIGDYIQSLAARQYIPNVDYYINREELGSFQGDETKLITNGWFTHKPKTWIPHPNIKPLFISFHINKYAQDDMLSHQGIEYLKKFSPIGCRDYHTTQTLQENGIDAYFSGCLTLTLDKYKVNDNEKSNNIYIVDPLFNYPSKKKFLTSFNSIRKYIKNGDIFKLNSINKILEKHFSNNLLQHAKYIEHELPSHTYSEEQKFEIAEDLLQKYARARLVITSRIHCALPCLALGTPVIFINGFDFIGDTCRFNGLTDLFNRIDVNNKDQTTTLNYSNNPLEKIDFHNIPENPKSYQSLTPYLRSTCENFINN